MRTIIFILASLVIAIFLLTFAANNLSKPSNTSVWMGVLEIVMAVVLLSIAAGQIIRKIKSNKN